VAKENADAVKKDLKLVGILFMIFAGIALFVGSFIIWNTFTMIVTQRSREIALLRAIGATRRQVMRSLVLEALVVGAAASAVGLGLGLLVAKGLKVLMDVVGLQPAEHVAAGGAPHDLGVPARRHRGHGRLALVPARRATKVLPVEALRESTPGAEKPSVRRGLVGLVIIGAGVAGMLSALYGGASMKLFGLGLVAAMVGVMVSLPLAVRPLAALIATPMRLRGMPGELAKQNAMRNPRRTSSTAAALMIGLTLVVSMGVFASSLKASFGDVLSGKTNAGPVPHQLQRPGPRVQPVGHRDGQGRRRRGRGLGQRLGPGPVRQGGLELLGGGPDDGGGRDEPRGDCRLGPRPGLGRRHGLEERGDGTRLGRSVTR
jgi:putative ABC transport system permease protein